MRPCIALVHWSTSGVPQGGRSLALSAVLLFAPISATAAFEQIVPPSEPRPTTEPATAPNKIVHVTVYQGNALVTRSVQVPQGTGLTELVVPNLPPQTIDTSLFTEAPTVSASSPRVSAPVRVMDDTRAEVRTKQDQILQLSNKNQEIQKQQEVLSQNLAMLAKLENFTAATMQQLTEKGVLSAENTIKLAGYVSDQVARPIPNNRSHFNSNCRPISSRLNSFNASSPSSSASASHTEREAVIVLDKTNAPPGQVRLNYLVSDAGWQPQYKLRAGGEKDPVQVEYLAAIQQQTGEDWSDVELVLSTAQPMLNAAPPELLALNITVGLPGQPRHRRQRPAGPEPDRKLQGGPRSSPAGAAGTGPQ